jgi:chromosome segregation ATPase
VDTPATSARLIGAIFVEKGLITEDQLETALEAQRETGDRLGEILVDRFGVERLDLASALAEQWAEYERQGTDEERSTHASVRDLVAVSDEWRGADQTVVTKRPIGEIFVERGFVTDEQLEDALTEQKSSGRRLGEILVSTGKMSRLELASALADQWASFQKLRPPSEAPVIREQVLPTPEMAPAPPIPAESEPPRDDALRATVEVLAARIEDVAASAEAWKPKLEQAAELLRARLEQVEHVIGHDSETGEVRLRVDVASLAARVDELQSPVHEWRVELAELAASLYSRLEQLETSLGGAGSAEEIARLEARLEEIATVVQALPESSDEWRAELATLTARVDALPVPSDEWRNEIATLAARIDALPPPSEEWRELVHELSARVDSLPVPSEEWREAVRELSLRFDALPALSEEWREQIAALTERIDALPQPSDEWRDAVRELSERIEARPEPSGDWQAAVQELAGRIEALAEPSDEWQEQFAALRARIEALIQPADDLRGEVEQLAARVDGLPTPSEEWREAVRELSGRIDALPAPSEEWREAVRELSLRFEALPAPSEEWREQIAALVGRIDALPVPSDEWREAVRELSGRIDSLPQPSDEWREAVRELSGRIDALPAPSEEWREQIAALVGRIDALPVPSDEWREAVGHLTARIDAMPTPNEEWRGHVAALAARIQALPASSDEWRQALGDTASALQERFERLEADAEARASRDELAGLQAALEVLTARLDALPEEDAGLREEVAALAGRLDSLPAPSEEWRGGLAAVTERLDELSRRLDDRGGERDGLDDLSTRMARMEEEGLEVRRQIGETDDRLAAYAGVVERVDEVERRLSAESMAAADLAARLDAALELLSRHANRLDDYGKRHADAVGRERVEALEQTVATRADQLDAAVAALGERVSEAAGQAQEAEAARHADHAATLARIDAVEGRAGELGGWRDAVGAATARLDEIEHRLIESTASEAVERHEQIETVRGELLGQVERVEQEGTAAADVAELKHTVDHVRARLDERADQDAAVRRALEEAVRDGLSALGERLITAHEAHLESGRQLQSSIEGLGRAIVVADGRSDAPVEVTHVVFTPTAEGYRLVECSGEAPELGARVRISESDDELVVTRVGASPLPFDRRTCAYLERAA